MSGPQLCVLIECADVDTLASSACDECAPPGCWCVLAVVVLLVQSLLVLAGVCVLAVGVARVSEPSLACGCWW
jgi:hypothetical protein